MSTLGSSSRPFRKSAPVVSVVMPVYNVEAYVAQAIESILGQTLTDLELICVDDGSTDGSLDILYDYGRRDGRLKILSNKGNLGTATTRNRGMAVARGDYIAVQDADDVSVPQRLEVQIGYLEQKPEVGVLGGAMLVLGADDAPLRSWQVFESDILIRCLLLFVAPIAQPTAIIRQRLIQQTGGYLGHLRYAQDYHLWVRLALISKLENLPEVLVYYRERPGQLTSKVPEMRRERTLCSLLALEVLGGENKLALEEVLDMSDLASSLGTEMDPLRVARASRLMWAILQRCLARWGADAEKELTLRQWLSRQVMRVAGSQLRGGQRQAAQVCLPAALEIAGENRVGFEEIWLRLQGFLGPNLARLTTHLVYKVRSPLLRATPGVSWGGGTWRS